MAEPYVTLTSPFVTITTNFHQIWPLISSILFNFWKEEIPRKIMYKKLIPPPSPTPIPHAQLSSIERIMAVKA